MKKLLAALMALMLLIGGAGAQAARYGWAFVIYDLEMSIEIDNAYQRTDAQTLEETNSFEKSGNVKPDLILEVYQPETYAQLFVYCAEGSPYDNLDELTGAYAEDLGASTDAPDANGTTWQIIPDGEFYGLECTRILSSFQNVNAEYVLLLSDDHSAYIITLITFDGTPPDSQLEGIAFGRYIAADESGEGLTIASGGDGEQDGTDDAVAGESGGTGAGDSGDTGADEGVTSERAGRGATQYSNQGLIGGLLGG